MSRQPAVTLEPHAGTETVHVATNSDNSITMYSCCMFLLRLMLGRPSKLCVVTSRLEQLPCTLDDIVALETP